MHPRASLGPHSAVPASRRRNAALFPVSSAILNARFLTRSLPGAEGRAALPLPAPPSQAVGCEWLSPPQPLGLYTAVGVRTPSAFSDPLARPRLIRGWQFVAPWS